MFSVIAISVCVFGFLVGIRSCCCSICNLLCDPGTNPTGSVTVELPALTDNGLDCTTCPDFAGTYILDRMDYATLASYVSSKSCSLSSGAESCHWALVLDPRVCGSSSLSAGENLTLTIRGDDGGVTDWGIELRLCFEIASLGGTVYWRDTIAESIPIDCLTELSTYAVPAANSSPDPFSLCTTSDDATVTF